VGPPQPARRLRLKARRRAGRRLADGTGKGLMELEGLRECWRGVELNGWPQVQTGVRA
jgi:hypothetical protein